MLAMNLTAELISSNIIDLRLINYGLELCAIVLFCIPFWVGYFVIKEME